MDKRINAAAAAFPKLEPLIQGHLQRSSEELVCIDEELFYQTSSRDIYVALTFSDSSQLIAKVPHDGQPTILDAATLLELDLEDITHIIPHAIVQVLRNQQTMKQLRAALHTSCLFVDMCTAHTDYRLDGLEERQRQKQLRFR